MCKVITKIYNFMQYSSFAWNVAWWNHHVALARMHDARMKTLDPEWREKI